ncbi:MULTISPECIES: alpha/beta hydrolase [unclassified Rhodococcus (in: high G+C Gram-positive bacteria)]|uniref:alpha/beta hydrolase n=1 Tax=unclassified Rhodococcus (in: high G+C Gram-positive bacteria) TaxID=192944 RepID=UPI001FFB8F6A|nr:MULTISPECIES: alpha/beta hydrolase [unclassified Rhodococcus (in: high G+C Gram-positive bacteria)]
MNENYTTMTETLPTAATRVVGFTVAGTRCEGTHFPARSDALATASGRPVVVLAHGLGGTRDSGLDGFAEAFAAAGLDAFTFDYRGFGTSGGDERQTVSLAGQVEDWQAAVDAASQLPGVDPQRIVLWGVSLAGGHVLQVAADRGDVAAVIAVVPMVDGLAAMRHALTAHGPLNLLKATATGIAARVKATMGKPTMMPVVGKPGQPGALTLSGAYEDFHSIAGPSWRNEVRADVGLELGTRAPAQAASKIKVPLLVQIADFDRSAPPRAAALAAFAGRAEVRHYPGDHFDLFPGKPFHGPAVEHAVLFLTRHLTPGAN